MASRPLIKPTNSIKNDSGSELENSIAALATVMSDVSRVKMLCALMDGRAWTATELSVVADIASSTASAHLSRLLNENFIICVAQGRHRYYRLKGIETAELLEVLMGASWKQVEPFTNKTPIALRKARTCYDHLAGEIAVNIYEFMLINKWIDIEGQSLTVQGKQQFEKLGIALDEKTTRKKCSACLDWSERKFHLGGYAGAALFTHFERKAWINRVNGFREVLVTDQGEKAFKKLFNIVV
ncbi:Helix-turn-helix domain protein [Marinomonas spartinae]|uniref:ArsR/SmtB family transcription factor n=1 Tax=Marinomonas spartinae TaxID=1792290 RepID=UPI000808B9B5|nr:helix-turn-helix transcriptional regulator [Marinomonas spartinae]SBS39820.1 Helix-turn-helix domain protein [Marinomonas spartinae]